MLRSYMLLFASRYNLRFSLENVLVEACRATAGGGLERSCPRQ